MLSDLEHGDMPETARKVRECCVSLFFSPFSLSSRLMPPFQQLTFLTVLCEVWESSGQELGDAATGGHVPRRAHHSPFRGGSV